MTGNTETLNIWNTQRYKGNHLQVVLHFVLTYHIVLHRQKAKNGRIWVFACLMMLQSVFSFYPQNIQWAFLSGD